jgi:hypothetical protein
MFDTRKLDLQDISDLRAYERERSELQQQVFEAKRLRRVSLGSIMSLVFENALTVRYQIQEMARVEKLTTDAQILGELKVYNPLIPDPGELSATLFIELTDEASLREWLPKLVGIERALLFRFGASGLERSRSIPDVGHAEQLTREDVTAAVHYVRFSFTPAQVEAFESGPVGLASDYPAYRVEVELPPETRKELSTDLRG